MPTIHRFTPKLIATDPNGLVVRSVDYYCAEEKTAAAPRTNHTVHDWAGRAVAQRDPRVFLEALAPPNSQTVYTLSGAALSTTSVDAGWRVALLGEAGHSVHSWDGRGSQRWVRYDTQMRPEWVFEEAAGGEALCMERLGYGLSDQASAEHNQCGQLIRHDDLAGTQLFAEFGLHGAVLEQTRHFLNDLTQPDWPESIADRDLMWEPGEGATSRSHLNAAGEVIQQTDAKGHRQLFHQTLDGQLREVCLQLNGIPTAKTLVSAIAYNAHGQTEREVAGNGVITTLKYDTQNGRLIRLLAQRGNEALQDLRYSYDPVGNVLSIEDAAQPIRYFANQRIEPVNYYSYDSQSQLIEATGWEAGSASKGPQFSTFDDPAPRANYRQTYRYDAGGNLLELTHEGPQRHGHRMVAAAHSNRCLPVLEGVEPDEEDFRQGFDGNGNLINLQPGQALAWDLRNQLCEVRPVERDSALNDRERYVYGADGMRLRKVREAHTNARMLIAETRYLPNLELRTNSGTGEVLQVINVQAGRSSVRVLHWESEPPNGVGNDQYRYHLNDHLGSCTLELDKDGEVISQEHYHPYGTTAWFAGRGEVEASYRTVRYSGKERDATGLYYYGFRYYVAGWQRWLNPDPAGIVVDSNLYRMLRNSPLKDVDILGLAPSGFFERLRKSYRRLKEMVTPSDGATSPGSKKPNAPGESAPVFERAIFALAQRQGQVSTFEKFNSFKDSVNKNIASQNVEVGGYLYRSHHHTAISSTGLIRASGAVEAVGDEFLVQLFQHSGMQAGLSGKVLSFTPHLNVAKRFSTREGSVLVRVDTGNSSVSAGFKTMAGIVAEESERLVRDKKIRVPSLINVLGYLGQGEYETFYMGGDVPHEAVEISYKGAWIPLKDYVSARKARSSAAPGNMSLNMS
ncbi:insecticidal toxin complex protein TccC [Pseudomonas laurylsulfativorans]|uniref:RHS repeat domain-containing protein n=1 Tax=Pseudomonas laurylsulfativorans TaxID=1943631 RepID=UPI0020A0D2AF|nr:RHS repeat-associated core domain-containing protein [Pseudomonas laurylsulfativorans]MCP1417232.1 insecticidal toxin complex protein TccC [Pseudomonas laurylsulfativorans]